MAFDDCRQAEIISGSFFMKATTFLISQYFDSETTKLTVRADIWF